MDEHLWLEEVEGERALAWVRGHNERSLNELEGHPLYAEFEAAATEVLTAQDRIPYAAIRDGFAYNFWQDETHVRGIWRRTTVESYLADASEWDTLLDIDRLAIDEDENWVYAGASPCRVDGEQAERYLVSLSIGGRDASTVREYDIVTRSFVDDGFTSAEAKQAVSWIDHDAVLIATDWGEGTTTESGYPLSVRRMNRGDDLARAVELFAGEITDVGVWPMLLRRADGTKVQGAVRRVTFFSGSYWLFPEGADEPLRIPIPEKADIDGTFDDQLIVSLSEPWQPDGQERFESGDLVSFDLGALLETGMLPEVRLMFRPNGRQAVQQVAVARDRVLLAYSDTVISQLSWMDRGHDGAWQSTAIEMPGSGQATVAYSDDRESTVLLSYQDFLTPDSLMTIDSSAASGGSGVAPRVVRSGTSHFDIEGLVVSQQFATSTDGTEIPYFLIHRGDIELDGSTPTLLYGYGGFEVSMTPGYSPTVGRLWLERGGAYAMANIRGGGEFGPTWHQAGLKGKRQVIYDDFIAVAEQLISTGVTSTGHLGIMGGSNGGLLMGVMITQRPDLWRAVVVQVPLLDMLRYHLLLAGASWVDEYGSPEDPAEREFLEQLSPYHRFDPDADYPTPFFVTSTKDDRVHPGHARKMAKRFEEADKPFLYFENIDGGHGAATNQVERAKRVALEFSYLRRLFDDA